ncbi:hypothetical protein [Rhodoferax sp.]|jgi:hypothetical protein|uniref:hypothetical protein n=1 Tax=Rhodoferax sp. TaxID=50421 RepID=UPI003783BCAD
MSAISTPKDWFDYTSALTPVFIALFVAFIAYRQWRVAREKLRLDLYNKRFTIFEVTLNFYQQLLDGRNISAEEMQSLHRKYIGAMIESKFLFSPSTNVYELMKEFNKSAFVIKGSRDVLKTQGIPPELFTQTQKKLTDEQIVLEAKLSSIEAAISKYLYFGAIGK